MKKTAKRFLAAVIAVMLILGSAMTVLAANYTIWDAWWDSNYNEGKVYIRWGKCDSSTDYKVQLYRTALGSGDTRNGKNVLTKTVSGTSVNVSATIAEKGKGTYYFTITPVKSPSPLDDMYIDQEMLDVDQKFLDKIRSRNSGGGSTGDITGWVATNVGWKYALKGSYVTNGWKNISGFWYYFNKSGIMLTGWQWIGGRCYYLNQIQGLGGYPEGACWINGITPDGYTVDASGAWVVNGYIQCK